MSEKINRESLNWQSGYHQGWIDAINRLAEDEAGMLDRARWLRKLGDELRNPSEPPRAAPPKDSP